MTIQNAISTSVGSLTGLASYRFLRERLNTIYYKYGLGTKFGCEVLEIFLGVKIGKIVADEVEDILKVLHLRDVSISVNEKESQNE